MIWHRNAFRIIEPLWGEILPSLVDSSHKGTALCIFDFVWWAEQAFEQTIELHMITDATTLIDITVMVSTVDADQHPITPHHCFR